MELFDQGDNRQPQPTAAQTRRTDPHVRIIEAARATREVAWGRWLDNVDPPSSSAAVPSLVPGGEAEGGQRQPSLAGRFSDGPRPALSTEIFRTSEIYHGRVCERALGVFKLWVPRIFASLRPSTRIIRHKTGSPSLVSQPHDLRSSVGPRYGVRARACRSCGALDAILAIYQRSKAVRRRLS